MRVLNRIKAPRGMSKMLLGDNGSKFSSQAMDLWAYHNGVRIDFSRSGKPTTMRTSSHSTAASDSSAWIPTKPAVQNELLCHADIRRMLNIYTEAVTADKREVASKV